MCLWITFDQLLQALCIVVCPLCVIYQSLLGLSLNLSTQVMHTPSAPPNGIRHYPNSFRRMLIGRLERGGYVWFVFLNHWTHLIVLPHTIWFLCPFVGPWCVSASYYNSTQSSWTKCKMIFICIHLPPCTAVDPSFWSATCYMAAMSTLLFTLSPSSSLAPLSQYVLYFCLVAASDIWFFFSQIIGLAALSFLIYPAMGVAHFLCSPFDAVNLSCTLLCRSLCVIHC